MTTALIIALVLIVVLSYFVASLSHEVRGSREEIKGVRESLREALDSKFVANRERDNARDHIRTTSKEIEEAIAKARQDREKIQELLTRMKDYMQNEQN